MSKTTGNGTNGKNGKWTSLLLSTATLAVGVGIGWGSKSAAIEANSAAIAKLQARQEADHDCLTQLRSDITYIKAAIDEIKEAMDTKRRNAR